MLRFGSAIRQVLVHISSTSLKPTPPPNPPKPIKRPRPKTTSAAAPPLPIRPAKVPRISTPGTQSSVKPWEPIKKPFRFVSLLPYVGLLALLLGLWMMIPKPPRPDSDVNIELMTPVIVVDAGHGGHDNGAVRNGLIEKHLALDTAQRLERLLKKRGFTVVMTRNDDRFLELFERAQVANQFPRALFVSVHYNDNATASGEGVETLYATEKVAGSNGGLFTKKVEAPPADKGAGFAEAIHRQLIARLGVVDRGTKARQLAVLRHTRCPAILVEGGFINNPSDAKRVREPAYRERLASAVAEGIEAFHKKRIMEATAQPLARTQ